VRATRHLRALIVIAVAITCLSQIGCVTRRLRLRSDPPGATAYVDDYEVGTTPCDVSYTYYGTRKVVLIKDGFETRTVMQEFPSPWYQYFPVDFVAENVVPWDIRDVRTVEYKLTPQVLVPTEQILRNGRNLRQSLQGGP